MKSTGEVMGVGETFAEAFLKSQLAAGVRLPREGKVFISVRDADKPRAIEWRSSWPARASPSSRRAAPPRRSPLPAWP
jgi:carbamoyl-phosphate synthase large subunit